ncbi:hypothetical protein ScPMuIL_009119 [Solemya velum]
MPKGKKKAGRKCRGVDNSQPTTDEDYDTADNLSTVSGLSEDRGSFPEEGNADGEVEETTAQEDFEDKLAESIDGTSQKSAQGRKSCLDIIQKSFARKYLIDFLSNRKETAADSLCRCLRKGKGDEQALAARCSSLLCIQLGQDAESMFSSFHPILSTIMLDNSAQLKARAECATAIALCSFVASSDTEMVVKIMNSLEDIFRLSYRKGDKSIPSHSPEMCRLHASALSAWTLLLSIAPPFLVDKVVESHLPRLPDLLHNQDVDLRIAAGETIALMYELAREDDEDFEGEDIETLCEILKNLATDSHKYRAKKERRHQRSIFRDVLGAVQNYESPDMCIKFGTESVILDSWTRRKQYDTFCQILGSGTNLHLQENTLVREVFGLGAPIPVSNVPAHRPSKVERTLFNAAAFKARTKLRAKHRDKRCANVSGGD